MPWIAAGAAIGGALLSKKGGDDRNSAQIASAREQMNFQEHMSNSAHQRQMTDLKQAGLNPILSAKYGGASAPGGAMPTIQDTITPAVNTGLQTYNQVKQGNVLDATVDKIIQDTDLSNAQSWGQDIENALKQLSIKEKQMVIETLIEELKIRKRAGEIADSDFGKWMAYIREFSQATGLAAPSATYKLGD